MNKYKLVPVELIERAAIALERFANDTLPGRNAASHLRATLDAEPVINIVATKNEQGQIVSVTLQDEDHRILEVIAEADVQGEHVGYIRRSALELMKNDELGVRANIIKEPRYRDCVALYTSQHPAGAALPPEITREMLGMIIDEVFGGGIEDASVIEDIYRVIARSAAPQPAEQQPAPDVAALVEALERISKRASEAECRQAPCSPIQRLLVDIMQQADDALAAHRRRTSHDNQ